MAHYGLKRTVDAATEPVTSTEAKLHLKVTGTDEDDLIDRCIVAARQTFENMTNRAVISQTWVLTLDRLFASCEPKTYWLNLPRSPLASVTSVYYMDTTGASTLWASSNYQVDIASEPGRLALAYGCTWPVTREMLNAVTITYVAGAANAAAVEDGIKHSILCLTADAYYQRETLSEVGLKPSQPSERTINQYRIGDSYYEFGSVE